MKIQFLQKAILGNRKVEAVKTINVVDNKAEKLIGMGVAKKISADTAFSFLDFNCKTLDDK